MWDVYLGGMSDRNWRQEFKNKISDDIKIYDPYIDNYELLDANHQYDYQEKDLQSQDLCAISVFYFNDKWVGVSSILEIGYATGSGRQIIVCLEGEVRGKKQIIKHCKHHGIPVCESIDEMVVTVEEFIGELSVLSQ